MNKLNEAQKLDAILSTLYEVHHKLMEANENIHVGTAHAYQVIANFIEVVRADGKAEKSCVVEAYGFAMDEYRRISDDRIDKEARTIYSWMVKTGYYDVATYLEKMLKEWDA